MALTDNLLSYYNLGDLNDKKNSYNLTNTGDATFVSGKIGNGINLNGSSQMLTNSDIATYIRNTGSIFSVNLWVNFNSIPSTVINSIVSMSVNNTSASYSFDYRNESGTRCYNLWTGSTGGTQVQYNITETAGTWIMLTFIFTGSQLILYRNTSQILTLNCSSVSRSNQRTGLTLGNFVDATSQYWLNGKIDECGVWQRVLSTDDLSQLYNSGNGISLYPEIIKNSNFFNFF